MSNMKNGFTTLNRWLGKKNKDKTAPNGKLSKSNANLNLSISSTNINETSQLEYNRITPLPAATSNAPFEQTFRITVLLPKDQLYVTRLGARVPLSKLLELVSENKQLDAEKYEFRNPVDPSQVYGCELTIGAVGLSEIRLCLKSESYDTFNTDEVIKLHRTPVIRDSLSSSEFSSRNSKHTTKTASPYSSSNSLNSMDSTGMNYTRTPVTPPSTLPTASVPQKAVAAPPRKKRAAPRPPSQTAIPEKSALVIANGETTPTSTTIPAQQQSNGFVKNATLPRKDYFVSTPNLTTSSTTELNGIDAACITNATAMENINDIAGDERRQGVNGSGQEDDIQQVKQKNARNLYGGSVQNLSSVTTTTTAMSTPTDEHLGVEFPEPSPRKRLLQLKRKSAAPAPPPRGSSIYAAEDSLSIGSTTAASVCSTPGTPPPSPHTPAKPDGDNTPPPDLPATAAPTLTTAQLAQETSPKPLVRESTTTQAAATKPLTTSTPVLAADASDVDIYATVQRREERSPNLSNVPKPVPRVTTTTLLNATNVVDSDSGINTSTTNMSTSTSSQHTNVSKVMLNRTPTPEPRSLSCEPPEVDPSLVAHLSNLHVPENDDDAVSKQADSGIGEPIPSPIPDSLPSEGSANECKSTFESSSDDDDMIKVYNFKLGKTVVKSMPEPKTLEELTALVAAQSDSGETTPAGTLTQEATPTYVGLSDATSWNFAIPISPPPNFADNAKIMENLDAEKAPDTPITPKIKERPVLNFEVLTRESGGGGGNVVPKAKSHDDVDRAAKPSKAAPEIQPAKVLPKTPTTPLPSPSTPMNEIVDELAAIISENRMDSLIRKVEDYSNEIESAKPNTLANFSITTISQQNSMSTSPESTLRDEEKLYRKRDGNGNISNTTLQSMQRTSPIIARADSFHQGQNLAKVESTTERQQQQENGLNSRSSSYLSLTKLDQNGLNLNRRRSSSELSIGESPSLQSLEVIKTILNSRKNSLANSSDGEAAAAAAKLTSPEISTNTHQNEEKEYKSTAATATTAASYHSLKVTSADLKPKSSDEDKATVQNEKSIVAAVEQVKSVVETTAPKPKELPKVYRYSGPPSINFATWSERPKVQVAIKNEGDYIVGDKQQPPPSESSNAAANPASRAAPAAATASVQLRTANASMPRNYRGSTPAGTFKFETTTANEKLVPPVKTPPVLAPKPAPATINRMGIPEKEFHVPITVKPLQDVTVESVELRRPDQNGIEETKQTKPVSITKVTLNGSLGTADNVEPTIRRPYSFYQYNAATIPRKADTNRFSTTATGPALLRATSITQLEANKPKSQVEGGGPEVATTIAAAPFGQNTLRKTGLKEKILAKEEAELQKQQQQPTPKVLELGSSATKSSHTPPLPAAAQQHKVFATFTSSSAKQPPAPLAHSFGTKNTTITSFINGYTPAHASAQQHDSIASAKTLQSAKLELKLQKSTNVYVNQTTTAEENQQPSTPKSAPPAMAPPPPPAPSMVPLKSKSASTTPTVDTRDQLLDAIRNFKREELNRT